MSTMRQRNDLSLGRTVNVRHDKEIGWNRCGGSAAVLECTGFSSKSASVEYSFHIPDLA
jgi:hypothetical protein